MNYDRYTKDPKNSALFNGNATSMGGNGAPDPSYTSLRTSAGLMKTGGGGGCITEGPFKEFVPRDPAGQGLLRRLVLTFSTATRPP